MSVSRNRKGYTIVEVMMFLAISGFMFVVAATFVSGKQANAEFRQGVEEAASDIQSVINTVSDGFYPSNGEYKCKADDTGTVKFSKEATEAGTNQGCVFLGKAIQFEPDGDQTRFNVYTLAGRQYAPNTAGKKLATLRGESKPRVVDPDSNNSSTFNIGDPPSLTDKKTFDWGLKVNGTYSYKTGISPYANPDPGAPARIDVRSLVFFGGLGSYSGDALDSGSQTISMISTTNVGSPIDKSEQTGINNINEQASQQGSWPATIVICFVGTNDKRASLTIDSSAGQGIIVNKQLGDDILPVCVDKPECEKICLPGVVYAKPDSE